MAVVKLTLSIPKEILEEAKKYSAQKRISLSKIVSNYFLYISQKEMDKEARISPEIKKLMGSIQGDNDLSYKELLHNAITEKHLKE